MTQVEKAKFELGRIVATQGALVALTHTGEADERYLTAHQSGDWGNVSDEDWEANELALENGGRLFSSYRLLDGTRIWIITEADRSVTTILLPSDY